MQDILSKIAQICKLFVKSLNKNTIERAFGPFGQCFYTILGHTPAFGGWPKIDCYGEAVRLATKPAIASAYAGHGPLGWHGPASWLVRLLRSLPAGFASLACPASWSLLSRC